MSIPTSENLKEWYQLAVKKRLVIGYRKNSDRTVDIQWCTGEWDGITYAFKLHSLESLRELCKR